MAERAACSTLGLAASPVPWRATGTCVDRTFTDPDGRIALWVGPEPTVNRVGHRYIDQLELTGFARRVDDLDRLASLGAERVRFPLLWERMAPERPDAVDWRWADARMQRLRELDLAPIIGLVHHGSGPRYTDLLDPGFAGRLADYAARVAERYPWVDAWTPVNEPVTTARFSALYGLWYPHGRSDAGFVRALLNQVDGVRRAGFATPSKRLEFWSKTLADWGWGEVALPTYARGHVHRTAVDASKSEYCLLPTFRLPTQIHTRSANAKWLRCA